MISDIEHNRMEYLVNQLNFYTEQYDKGTPIISDKEYDDLYFELLELEKTTGEVWRESPTQRIHYRAVNELKKVKHNHPMLSAAKTKDWNEFINYFGYENVVGMVKLDGLTCSLRYLDGKLVSAETRGNGEIGEDIFHNALVIPSIPKIIDYKEELIVDGEIICKYSDFEPFSNDYANPRNFASGSIRLLNSHECAERHLTFVAWNVVKGLSDNLLDNFNALDKLNFETVPWTSSFDWDAKEFLVDCAKKLGYPIDGLVGRFTSREYGESLGSTGHHTKAIFAFKFYDEEYETELVDIEYSIGRTGVLTPVAVFEPVDTGDSTVTRASLHNLSVMGNILPIPFKGQKIKIAKMNEIIPQIVWAEKVESLDNIIPLIHPVYCPICEKAPTIKDNDGVITLVCENPDCEGKIINIIDHFVGKKGLDVKGLSKATIEKLINAGWVNSRADIFKLSDKQKEWQNLPGFGPKSVSNILTAIEGAKNTNFEKYLSSLGIPLIGQRVSRVLSTVFSSYDDFRKAIREGYDFSQLEGFGYEMNKAIHGYDYTEADEIAEMLNFKQPEVQTEVPIYATSATFVITGKLSTKRDEWVHLIESRGGKVGSSVTSKTDYLVCNSVENTTKYNKAKELGIPIITEEELQKILG